MTILYGVYGPHEPDATTARPAWLPDRCEAGPSCYLPWLRARSSADTSSARLAVHRPDGSVGWIAED